MLYADEPGLLPEVPRRESAPETPGQTVMAGPASPGACREQALELVTSYRAERMLSPGVLAVSLAPQRNLHLQTRGQGHNTKTVFFGMQYGHTSSSCILSTFAASAVNG